MRYADDGDLKMELLSGVWFASQSEDRKKQIRQDVNHSILIYENKENQSWEKDLDTFIENTKDDEFINHLLQCRKEWFERLVK